LRVTAEPLILTRQRTSGDYLAMLARELRQSPGDGSRGLSISHLQRLLSLALGTARHIPGALSLIPTHSWPSGGYLNLYGHRLFNESALAHMGDVQPDGCR
jgi:hypothetical protein